MAQSWTRNLSHASGCPQSWQVLYIPNDNSCTWLEYPHKMPSSGPPWWAWIRTSVGSGCMTDYLWAGSSKARSLWQALRFSLNPVIKIIWFSLKCLLHIKRSPGWSAIPVISSQSFRLKVFVGILKSDTESHVLCALHQCIAHLLYSFIILFYIKTNIDSKSFAFYVNQSPHVFFSYSTV